MAEFNWSRRWARRSHAWGERNLVVFPLSPTERILTRLTLGFALQEFGWTLHGLGPKGWAGVASKGEKVSVVFVRPGQEVNLMSGRDGWPVFHPLRSIWWGWHVEDADGLIAIGKSVGRCVDALTPDQGFDFALALAGEMDGRADLRPLEDPRLVAAETVRSRISKLHNGVELRYEKRLPFDLGHFLYQHGWQRQKRHDFWYAPLCRLNLLMAQKIATDGPWQP